MIGGKGLPDGTRYLPDFVEREVEVALLRDPDRRQWSTDLKRRVQRFGWRYDYTARRVTPDMELGQLPGGLAGLALRLHRVGLFLAPPDQVIANEYLPGQGISAHVDCTPCFGDTIASLSLFGACVVRFVHRNSAVATELALAPRSQLILKGPARYDWTKPSSPERPIPAPGGRVPRTRIVSLAFRNVQRRA